ncbi:M23 family metallopeptidase [Chryseobacterium sp. A301]
MNPISTLFHFLLFLFPFFLLVYLSNNPKGIGQNSSFYLAGDFRSMPDFSKLEGDTLTNPLLRDSIYLKPPSKKKAMEAFNRFKDGMGKATPDSLRTPGKVHFSLKSLPPVVQFNGGLKTSLDSLRSIYKRERANRKEYREEKRKRDSLSPSSKPSKKAKALNPIARDRMDSSLDGNRRSFTKEPLSPSKKARRDFYFPLEGKLSISSPYGNRVHPLSGEVKFHRGLDFRASYESVIAVMDGVVEKSGWDSKGGGYYMTLQHEGGISTSYLHLSQRYYRKGEKVLAGYIIARSGNSGGSTGPHLHFMVRENGELRSPQEFLYNKSMESGASSKLYAQN